MLVAQKCRIYPNETQKQKLSQMFGCARFVYNKNLEAFKNHEKLNEIQLKEEFPFLKECSAQVLQRAKKDLQTALKNHFKYHYGFPVFKSKKSHQAIRDCMVSQKSFDNKTISFPKIGKIKRDTQDFRYTGKLKSITISKTKTEKYFASLLVDIEDIKRLPTSKNEVGIDLGLKDFLIESNENKVKNPKFEKKNSNKLRRFQRELSRRKLGGKNREKSRIRLARIHEKVFNSRNDFLHKLSWRIVRDNQSIFIEDLNIKGMIKNHKLARAISDSSWNKFVSFLEYKAERYGRNLVKIDRFYPSSKTCSICGYVKHNLKLSDREWICSNCNAHLDRDINAAINILNRGKHGDSLLNITNLCNLSLIINENHKSGEFVGRNQNSFNERVEDTKSLV